MWDEKEWNKARQYLCVFSQFIFVIGKKQKISSEFPSVFLFPFKKFPVEKRNAKVILNILFVAFF